MTAALGVVMLLFAGIQCQDMFNHHFGRGIEQRMLEFNEMNKGFGEASRLFHSIQSGGSRGSHNAHDNGRERFRHQNHAKKTFADEYENMAVFKGEVSCYTLLGSFEFTDYQAILANEDFVVKSIEVIDDDKGSHFPYVQHANDFIAYDPYPEYNGESKFVRVVIKHKGCVNVSPGCIAVTTFMASYKPDDQFYMGFTRINLNSRAFEQECSIFRRIFNFWPFN